MPVEQPDNGPSVALRALDARRQMRGGRSRCLHVCLVIALSLGGWALPALAAGETAVEASAHEPRFDSLFEQLFGRHRLVTPRENPAPRWYRPRFGPLNERYSGAHRLTAPRQYGLGLKRYPPRYGPLGERYSSRHRLVTPREF